MSQSISPQEAAASARKLLDARVAIIEQLAAALSRLSAASAAFEDAEREYGSMWAQAERSGWTATELRKVGLSEPGRRRPGRPKKPRSLTDVASVEAKSAPGN